MRANLCAAMEASLRAPFIIRWPGKAPAGCASNQIVHIGPARLGVPGLTRSSWFKRWSNTS